MTALALLLATSACIAASACGGRSRVEPMGPTDLAIRDTAEYENTIYGGQLGVLYRDGEPIDSIDLGFGVQPVPGGVLFLPVRSERDPELGTLTYMTEHVLYDGHDRHPIAGRLPHFDPSFSSPNVIDSLLYYWGLDREADYVYRVSAVRYDFRADRADSALLYRAPLATDNPYHFQPPERDDGRIRYETHGRIYWVSPETMTIVRDSVSLRDRD